MWWGFTTHSRQQTLLIAGRFCCGFIASWGEYDAFIVITFNLDIYEGNSIVVVDKQLKLEVRAPPEYQYRWTLKASGLERETE